MQYSQNYVYFSAIQVSFPSRYEMHLGSVRGNMGMQHVPQQWFSLIPLCLKETVLHQKLRRSLWGALLIIVFPLQPAQPIVIPTRVAGSRSMKPWLGPCCHHVPFEKSISDMSEIVACQKSVRIFLINLGFSISFHPSEKTPKLMDYRLQNACH